jgi:hypothetical protein
MVSVIHDLIVAHLYGAEDFSPVAGDPSLRRPGFGPYDRDVLGSIVLELFEQVKGPVEIANQSGSGKIVFPYFPAFAALPGKEIAEGRNA